MGGVSDIFIDIENELRDMHAERPRPTWAEAVARMQRDFSHEVRTTGEKTKKDEAIRLEGASGREWIDSVLEGIGEDWDDDWDGDEDVMEDGEEEDMEEDEYGRDDEPWVGDAPPLRKGLAAGSPISLRGIVSKPELNGRTGWSFGLDPKTGRCAVQLEALPGEEQMPKPFTVKSECVASLSAFSPDLSSVAEYISDEEIAAELDGDNSINKFITNANGRRSVERTKRAINAALTVIEGFYYGPKGPKGLNYAIKERLDDLTRTFQSAATVKSWVQNMVASGSPDFVCEHTGNEVHLFCLNARQMAAFVRTGYDPTYGVLPQTMHSKLVPDEY